MATFVKMPKIGLSDESAIIAKWHKKTGEEVRAGEILFTIETDKSTFDVEAEVDGTLLEIFYDEGEEVQVLADVAIIGSKGEKFSSSVSAGDKPENLQKFPDRESQTAEDRVQLRQITEGPNSALLGKEHEKIKISPRARNLAERGGVDFRIASPSGPEGRIIERDIVKMIKEGPVFTPAAREEYQKSDISLPILKGTGIGERVTTADIQNAAKVKETEEKAAIKKDEGLQKRAVESSNIMPPYKEIKFSNIRKVIARNMMNSLESTAQLTINTTFDATEIMAYREKVKANREKCDLENITLNDMVLYAVTRTLLKHPELNAHLVDDTMIVFENVNLGVAVDTERGLMVPTIFNADRKSLNEISKEVKELAEQCRKGSINPDYLKGGTFTVTNLGTLDVEHFTPILNPPQTGILGICSIILRPRMVSGGYEYYPAMGLSLTFDHRAVDGAPAARFLKDLKRNLENFSLLLAR